MLPEHRHTLRRSRHAADRTDNEMNLYHHGAPHNAWSAIFTRATYHPAKQDSRSLCIQWQQHTSFQVDSINSTQVAVVAAHGARTIALEPPHDALFVEDVRRVARHRDNALPWLIVSKTYDA